RVNHPEAAGFKTRLVGAAETDSAPLPLHQGSSAGMAEFRVKLTTPGILEISDGNTVIAHWTLKIIDDRPPSIAVTESVSVAARNALQIKYHVEDDYGVASARALIKQANEIGGEIAPSPGGKAASASKRLGEPPVIPLPLPRASLKSGNGQTFKDLTAHPWAGLPVVMTMIAEDQAGQIGGSDAGTFMLPERRFTKPLAKALIEQRKALVNRPDRTERVLKALEAITMEPEAIFPDFGLYLGVRSVYWRLRNDGERPAIESAVAQLWDIALKIEDGDLPEAERELREAQERLAKALDENASEEEIQKLMNELRQALAKFMDAMRENSQNAQKNDQDNQKPTRQVTSKELEKMLKDIEDLAKTGSRDAARQMLAELQEMLENSQNGKKAQEGQSQEMMSQLDELSELMAKQQQLLDETYEAKRKAEGAERGPQSRNAQKQSGERGQQGRQAKPGEPGTGEQGEEGQQGETSLQELRERQEALLKQLDKLREGMQGLNEGSRQKLEDAARSMGEAGQSLEQQDADTAAAEEGQAVESLREGAKGMAEQMMQSMQGQQGPGGNQDGNTPRDPLGRANRSQGAENGDNVKVPDAIDIQRAREILDELRRRLGERYRPEMELEYLDRLIKRF
ncbi:MAG: TIGR02302 family protein, partial [Chitinophagales bacterium]|nr:TIGR02302 family protein [Hyphomicrobiales bacterium]